MYEKSKEGELRNNRFWLAFDFDELIKRNVKKKNFANFQPRPTRKIQTLSQDTIRWTY